MLSTRSALLLALLAGAAASALPAQTGAPVTSAPSCQSDISSGARQALVELQTAVNARDLGALPGRVAAAQAVARTRDDKCFLAQLELQAAAARGDYTALRAAIEAQLASGAVPKERVIALFNNLGRVNIGTRRFTDASIALERSLQLAPANGETLLLLADLRGKQGRLPEALALYRQAIDGEVSAGRRPSEDVLKRAVAVAYDSKNPAAIALSQSLVSAFPTPHNWRDALRIYADVAGLRDPDLLDVFRLQRLTKALAGEGDFGRYAAAASAKGFPGEARAVIDEGVTAGLIDRNRPVLRAALLAGAKAATAKGVMASGEMSLGTGDYAAAAEQFRAALSKPGIDRDVANLRLGMALAASGDKAGATTALSAVTGAKADIARYWLAYVASRP